jgi:hypothetical protein
MPVKKIQAAKHGCPRKGAKIKAKAPDNQVTILGLALNLYWF